MLAIRCCDQCVHVLQAFAAAERADAAERVEAASTLEAAVAEAEAQAATHADDDEDEYLGPLRRRYAILLQYFFFLRAS